MEQEITLVMNYLDKIGEKLGIGANMLWPYLMKQQLIEAYMCVAFAVIMLSICYFTWTKYAKNPHRHDEKWKDGMYFYSIAMVVSGVIGAICSLVFVLHGVFKLANTEYMAFKALIELLKTVK